MCRNCRWKTSRPRSELTSTSSSFWARRSWCWTFTRRTSRASWTQCCTTCWTQMTSGLTAGHKIDWQVDWVAVSRPTPHKPSRFGDFFSAPDCPGLVLARTLDTDDHSRWHWLGAVDVSKSHWSRDQIFGLDFGLKTKICGLGFQAKVSVSDGPLLISVSSDRPMSWSPDQTSGAVSTSGICSRLRYGGHVSRPRCWSQSSSQRLGFSLNFGLKG